MRSDGAGLAGFALVAGGLVALREAFSLALLPALALAVAVPALGAVAVLAVARHGLAGVAVGLLGLGVATTPWNAVSAGPVRVTPVALGLATVLLLALAVVRGRGIKVPAWVWILTAAIAVTTVVSLVAPPSPAAFASRYTGDLPDALAGIDDLGLTGAVAGAKWLVAAFALPLAVCLAAPDHLRLVPAMVDGWIAGVVVSAAVAVTDGAGWTTVGAWLDLEGSFAGRQAGLSAHPNHLALGIAMVLPLVMWRAARATGARSIAVLAAAALVLTGGLVVSGSRAGVAGVLVAAALCAVVDPRIRRLLPALAPVGAVVALLAVLAVPGVASGLAERLRLDGSGGADLSDAIRSGLAAQAWADFAGSPVNGAGFTVLPQGHNVYLQALAAGGLVLLAGYVVAWLGCLLDAWSTPDPSGLARALATSAVTFLAVGLASNQIADAFVFVPFALVAGLRAAHRHPHHPAGPPVRAVPDRAETPT